MGQIRQFLAALFWTLGALVILAVTGIAALFLLASFGSVNTYYRCPGQMEVGGDASQSTAYIRTQMYKPFMFWAKNDGVAWVETFPQGDFLLFQEATINNEVLVTFKRDDDYADFTKNGQILRMRLGSERYFSGECSRVDR